MMNDDNLSTICHADTNGDAARKKLFEVQKQIVIELECTMLKPGAKRKPFSLKKKYRLRNPKITDYFYIQKIPKPRIMHTVNEPPVKLGWSFINYEEAPIKPPPKEIKLGWNFVNEEEVPEEAPIKLGWSFINEEETPKETKVNIIEESKTRPTLREKYLWKKQIIEEHLEYDEEEYNPQFSIFD